MSWDVTVKLLMALGSFFGGVGLVYGYMVASKKNSGEAILQKRDQATSGLERLVVQLEKDNTNLRERTVEAESRLDAERISKRAVETQADAIKAEVRLVHDKCVEDKLRLEGELEKLRIILEKSIRPEGLEPEELLSTRKEIVKDGSF